MLYTPGYLDSKYKNLRSPILELHRFPWLPVITAILYNVNIYRHYLLSKRIFVFLYFFFAYVVPLTRYMQKSYAATAKIYKKLRLLKLYLWHIFWTKSKVLHIPKILFSFMQNRHSIELKFSKKGVILRIHETFT